MCSTCWKRFPAATRGTRSDSDWCLKFLAAPMARGRGGSSNCAIRFYFWLGFKNTCQSVSQIMFSKYYSWSYTFWRCEVDYVDGVGMLGAPCISHSKNLGWTNSSAPTVSHTCRHLEVSLNPFFRMGHGNKFENVVVKHCHDVGSALIRKMRFSLHENVTEFDEAWISSRMFRVKFTCHVLFLVVCSMQDGYLKENTNTEIQKALLLVGKHVLTLRSKLVFCQASKAQPTNVRRTNFKGPALASTYQSRQMLLELPL